MSPRISLPLPFLWIVGACLLTSSAGCGGGNGGITPQPIPAVNSIAFISTRDGAPEIYRMNPDGSEQTRVTNGIGNADNPSQSRDGRIVFESNRDGNSEIYTVNRDGSGLKRLTNDVDGKAFKDIEPTFSPDGKLIAWTSSRGGEREFDTNIWLMNADGSNKRQFVFNTAPADDFATVGSSDPAWTADGKQLAYLVFPKRESPLANNAIQLKTVTTGAMTKPDFGFGKGSQFRFNGNRKIIYSRPYSRSNGAFLSIYDFDSPKDTIVFPDRYKAQLTDRSPDYSPDGQSIVWDAIVDGKPAQIYRANADSSGVAALTTEGGNYSPDW